MTYTMNQFAQPREEYRDPFANLISNALGSYSAGVKARYLPLNLQADAASKLAYSNLMGPQFISKLLANPDILANTPDEQKRALLDRIMQVGTNPINLSGFNRNAPTQMNAPQQNTQPQPTQQQSPYGNLSQQDRSAIEGMQPGDSYVIQGDKQQPSMEKPNKTFAENRANYAGVVKEGEELGKIRAGDIKELNDVVYRGQTNQYTLDNVSKILGSPEFEQIRQVPLLGKHELSYYAKFGTPEQQNMIGQYYTSTGNIIKDSARDFAGQFRKGEQQLLENMKPSASDTPDTARGKVESLSVMNKMLLERSKLISQYMQKNHMNKGEAEDIADKQIDGDEIRKQIHDNLYPKVKIRNKTTGEEKEISIDEARKLGIQNV